MVFRVLPGLDSQEDHAIFFGSTKRMLRIAILEHVDLQKKFPEVPIEFRVRCGNPESRLIIPPGLGIVEG